MKKSSLSARFETLGRDQLTRITGGGQSAAIPACRLAPCAGAASCPPRWCHCSNDTGLCTQGPAIIDPVLQ
ncbi:hypothetical protein KTO58_14700 [Chitinophaga pendula]|uniref:hypothetical protein n=1 Tax=Chitinophaga TaxID=79328 RepID=UPI0012FD7DAA|nr:MULTISPECIES: hypothetical protein [Chitinophaga]UCJ04950.1 hypothetical protein KTO58_14700 [Chitinophaga pendula]